MAGEIQIGGTTFATESGGTVTIANVDSATNRTNLGLGSIATQASDSIDINGGAIDGATIGGTSAAAGTFTTFTSTGIDDNASSTALTIDSSGNVGIGPSSLASSWEGNLNIVQPASTKTELFFLRNTQVEAHLGFLGSNTDSNFYVNSGPALGDYGAYLTNQGTSWASVSDERQKTDLIPIVDAINKIKQLRTVTGRFLTDEESKSRSFLIAQDFVNNFPEAVDTNNPEKYGLSYTDVIPLVIAGLKEQQALIESQQSQIDALTARIKALETT